MLLYLPLAVSGSAGLISQRMNILRGRRPAQLEAGQASASLYRRKERRHMQHTVYQLTSSLIALSHWLGSYDSWSRDETH